MERFGLGCRSFMIKHTKNLDDTQFQRILRWKEISKRWHEKNENPSRIFEHADARLGAQARKRHEWSQNYSTTLWTKRDSVGLKETWKMRLRWRIKNLILSSLPPIFAPSKYLLTLAELPQPLLACHTAQRRRDAKISRNISILLNPVLPVCNLCLSPVITQCYPACAGCRHPRYCVSCSLYYLEFLMTASAEPLPWCKGKTCQIDELTATEKPANSKGVKWAKFFGPEMEAKSRRSKHHLLNGVRIVIMRFREAAPGTLEICSPQIDRKKIKVSLNLCRSGNPFESLTSREKKTDTYFFNHCWVSWSPWF